MSIAGCAPVAWPRGLVFYGLAALAARHYGNGEAHQALGAALSSAAAYHAYVKSAESLECALLARPSFAQAYSVLRTSYERMASPQRDDDYHSLFTRSKVDDIVRAQEKALASFRSNELTPPEAVLPHNGAFDKTMLALLQTDPQKAKNVLRDGLQALEAFLKTDGLEPAAPESGGKPGIRSARDPKNPVLYLNLALAYLVADRAADAEKVYRLVIDDLKVSEDWNLTLSILTDLNIFTHYCSNVLPDVRCRELEDVVATVKQKLVAGRWQEQPATGAALRDVSVSLSPSSASWRGKLDPGAEMAQKLAVVWYVLDAPPLNADDDWHVPRAVPGLSRTIDLATLQPDADGFVGMTVPYPRGDSRCLPRGQFTAELYLDGVLVPGLRLTPLAVDFEDYRSRELNVAFCAPKEWRVHAGLEQKGWSADLFRLYSAKIKDETENVMVLATFFAPRGLPAKVLEEQFTQRTLEAMFSQASKQGRQGMKRFMPDMKTFNECGAELTEGAFAHRALVTPEGFVHVAVMSPVVPAKDACAVLASLDTYLISEALRGPPAPDKP